MSIRDVKAQACAAVSGTVVARAGNRLAVQDDTGTVMVDAGPPWHHPLDIPQGERITVEGRFDGETLAAVAIERADGRRIEIRPRHGPPPWAGGPLARP